MANQHNSNKQSASNNEGKDPIRVEAGRKAAETRKAHDNDSFQKMGQKGGSSKQGNKSSNNR